MWQWRGDKRHAWHCYSADIVEVIEEAYAEDKQIIDLSEKFEGYNYVIDLNKMVQINKHTKYHRPIRRTDSSYPLQRAPTDQLTNGIDEQTSANNLPLYNADMGNAAATNSGDSPKSKKGFSHQVSNLWKKIVKNGTSDSTDVDASVNKKLCKTNSAGSSSVHNSHVPFVSDFDANVNKASNSSEAQQYATVNGKPWKYSWPPNTPQSHVKPVPGIDPLPDTSKTPRKGRKGKGSTESLSSTDILSEFTKEVALPPSSPEEQVCIICCEDMHDPSSYDGDSTLVQLQLCSHIFHKSCIKAMYESGAKDHHIQCPTCKTIHGVKHGTQPAGKMTYHVLPYSLPGHPDDDTIQIIYDIKHGIQGPEHPNPGKSYTARGFPRYCYLPDSEIGRKILRLLVKAWERRLVFTIGSSSTTGETDTVTWNEIHHKTEFGCNRHGHGYPDPLYFQNVLEELAAHGVTDSLYAWLPAV